MERWAVVGALSFIVFAVYYISDNWSGAAWRRLSKLVSLAQVLGEWLVFMLLFGALTVLLEKILDSACWALCFKVIESVPKPSNRRRNDYETLSYPCRSRKPRCIDPLLQWIVRRTAQQNEA